VRYDSEAADKRHGLFTVLHDIGYTVALSYTRRTSSYTGVYRFIRVPWLISPSLRQVCHVLPANHFIA